MKRLLGLIGIAGLVLTLEACSERRRTTTIRTETVETKPRVIERETTIERHHEDDDD